MTDQKPGGPAPLVSVVVPCYNQARFLKQTVESVLAQTLTDWECLLINDGSTDDTPEVAQRLAAADSRIRYVEQANRGLSGARNRGLDESRGRYIQLLDSDDLLLPRKLEIQVAALAQTNEPAIAYCDYSNCDADGRPLDAPHLYKPPEMDHNDPLADMALRWESEMSVPPMCWLFDARFFGEMGIRFNENQRKHEDWDCWMRILATGPRLFYVPEKLAVYRRYGGSMSCDYEPMLEEFLQAIERQRLLHADNQHMQDIFDRKVEIARESYRRMIAAKRAAEPSLANTFRALLRRITPRPMREKIRQIRDRRA